jgi:hypothetical protein
VALFLDRVLLGWYQKHGWLEPDITEQDIRAVAALAARARLNNRPLFRSFDRPDRVFLHRALEHVWAKRLLASVPHDQQTVELFQQIADENWVRNRYGTRTSSSSREFGGHEPAEKAARSSLSARYELGPQADPQRATELENDLLRRWRKGRATALSGLLNGPNLLAPNGEAFAGLEPRHRQVAVDIRDAMFRMALRQEENDDQGFWDWSARREALDALMRALLRDDLLLRMPVEVFRGGDETWAASLFAGLHRPMRADGTGETLAQRLVAFLNELGQKSVKERRGYLAYAMNPRAESVARVTGAQKINRGAVFCAFNTPLLPDVLVCTNVGGEGIDLHRECSHVIHYDLEWNPARVEQKTGRTDRIGSKTERERKSAHDRIIPAPQGRAPDETELPGLDVAMPYLAATYDERMFDVLRKRAQTFEILTGGDPTADRDTSHTTSSPEDSLADVKKAFVPLPAKMLDELRVNLEVKRGDSHRDEVST